MTSFFMIYTYKKMKKLKFNLICASLFLILTSCNKENIEPENDTQAESLNEKGSILNSKVVKNNSYHFIRFNIANKQQASKFISEIKNAAKSKKGKLFTVGKPITCVERTCFDRTLLIEFPNSRLGNMFFNFYKKNLTSLSKKATKKLNYSVGAESPSTDNDTIKSNIYGIGDFNFINQNAYITNYVPGAVKSVIKNKGNFIVGGVNKCLIGKCNTYNVVIGFNSKAVYSKWYNSSDYQKLIPIRKRATSGGGFMIAKKF